VNRPAANPPIQRLPVTLEGERLATLPVGTHRRATLGSAVGLAAESTVGAASRGDPTKLTVLVGRGADPVDARIATDGLVGRVDHDDLEVLVRGILRGGGEQALSVLRCEIPLLFNRIGDKPCSPPLGGEAGKQKLGWEGG